MASLKYSFFFYGTLMDDLVLEIVTGKNYPRMRQQRGILENFKRVKVKGAQYPAIISSIGNQVDGIFVEGVLSEGVACLDDFEDDQYERKSVSVSLGDGRRVKALAYIAGSQMLLEYKEWNFEHWKLNYRPEFLKKLKKGMRVY